MKGHSSGCLLLKILWWLRSQLAAGLTIPRAICGAQGPRKINMRSEGELTGSYLLRALVQVRIIWRASVMTKWRSGVEPVIFRQFSPVTFAQAHYAVVLTPFAGKAIRARLNQFDVRAMAGGCGQTLVARQQGYPQPARHRRHHRLSDCSANPKCAAKGNRADTAAREGPPNRFCHQSFR
jgi:hypothetical protein